MKDQGQMGRVSGEKHIFQEISFSVGKKCMRKNGRNSY